jgi:hypothetical protein
MLRSVPEGDLCITHLSDDYELFGAPIRAK